MAISKKQAEKIFAAAARIVRAPEGRIEVVGDKAVERDPIGAWWVPARVFVGPTDLRQPKAPSRSERWVMLAGEARSALEALREVQEEFEQWRDNLPDNLQNSSLYEKLETICAIDIQSAIYATDEAESADIPLGFGRD